MFNDMKISLKILGSGCAKCKKLEEVTSEVVKENNFDADVQRIEDLFQIMSYRVMATPSLVINEKVVVSGRVPSKSEIKAFIEKETKRER